MNLLAEVRAIVAREIAHDAETRDVARVANAISELPDMDAAELGVRRYRDYSIVVSRGDSLKHDAEALTALRPLHIAAAPELVELMALRDGYVLVERYWACPDERLLPAQTTMTAIEPDAARRFRRDMEVLAEHGKMHRYAGRGYAHWLLGERSGTIVLDTWHALKPVANDHEREELFEGIDRLLAKRTRPT